VIAGTPSLQAEVNAEIARVLRRPRDRASVAADVKTMRTRIEAEKGTVDIWDLKQVRGGLVDLEFIAQFLQVVSAHEHPDVLDQTTEKAFFKLGEAGVLSPSDVEILVPAARLYHNLTQVLRLCVTEAFVPQEAPAALKDLLARAAEMPDFWSLEVRLKETLNAVHQAFDRLVA